MENQATEYLKYADLAKVAYADLTKGMTKQAMIDELSKDRGAQGDQLFTVEEAKKIADKYMVSDSVWDPVSGAYAAILAERNPDGTAGSKTMVIRGTELTDMGDIAAGIDIATLGVTSNGQYNAIKEFYDNAVESGIIGAGEKIDVTGHSLGGYLATSFTLLNSNAVGHAYTYNSPGMLGAVLQLMTHSGMLPENLPYSQITNIAASQLPVHISGYGILIGGIVELPGRSHSIQSIIDTLSRPGAYYAPDDSLSWWPIDLLTNIRDLFTTAQTIVDPIILDLDGDGVETTGVKAGVYFDQDGNGFAEQTGWAKSEDGLLVLDRNGNGTIDNGRELFGDQTLMADGTRAANGFQALAELDGNADGKIDVNDAAYAKLKVWQDVDGNGYSSPSELKTLSEVGVGSINTGYTDSTLVDANGNAHKQVGFYTKTDGSTGTATNVWFKTDKMFAIANEWLDVPEDMIDLPDLRGAGNVYDLHQAMVRDSSGQLKLLVQQFIAATDPVIRTSLMDEILFKWTESDVVPSTSRGSLFDARKLVTLEKFIGENFRLGTSPNPGTTSINPLNDAYKILSESMYSQLMAQTHLKLSLYTHLTLPTTPYV